MKAFSDIISKPNSPANEIWIKWCKLVNMTPGEIKDFLSTENIEDTTLTEMVDSGDTFEKAETNWNSFQWEYAKTSPGKISRTLKMRLRMTGNPFERDGIKTNWIKGLMKLGHDPRKPLRKSV